MQGRWTIFLEGPHASAVTESPALYQPPGHTAVPVVPCDDAAIERAADDLAEASGRTMPHNYYRQRAASMFRAAGEAP